MQFYCLIPFQYVLLGVTMGRAEQVLEGLAKQQKEGFLCDVRLEAEGQYVPAHRNILVATSQYFESMFSGAFQESKLHTVPIKGVTYPGLHTVVKCIYSTEIDITDDNIGDIFPVVHLFQMDDVITECLDWMRENVSKENCFTILRLVEKYNLEDVEDALHGVILHDFTYVSSQPQFKELTHEVFCRFLASDLLRANAGEFEVFQLAKQWINYKEIRNQDTVWDIMKNIRFALLPLQDISDMIRGEPLVIENENCRHDAAEAIQYHSNLYTQPLYDGEINRPRGKSGILVIPRGKKVPDGWATLGNGESLHFVPFPGTGECQNESSLETPIVFDSMNSVTLNNFVFLFGIDCRGFQNFAKRYDARHGSWIELKSVPRSPAVGSAIACNDSEIFLLGGMIIKEDSSNDTDDFYSDTVDSYCACSDGKDSDSAFMYSISDNTWKAIEKLPIKASFASACFFKGMVFYSGGNFVNDQNDALTSDKVYAFDPNANMWLTKAPMTIERCDHLMEALEDYIYVLGGT